MSNGKQDGIQCSQFEALLAEFVEAEALDQERAIEAAAGSPGAEKEALRRAFKAHRQSCPACGPLFSKAREGMLLLRSLPELDPPKNLVHNILAATSLAEAATQTAEKRRAPAQPSLRQRWQKLVQPGQVMGALLHSRFAMSFCMAFFSLSLTLSLSGVKITQVYRMASHPTTFGRSVVLQYTQVEAKVTRYYENLRIVYDAQILVHRLRESAAPQDNNNNKPDQQNQNRRIPGGKEKDEQEYSLERDGSLIAHATLKHEGAEL